MLQAYNALVKIGLEYIMCNCCLHTIGGMCLQCRECKGDSPACDLDRWPLVIGDVTQAGFVYPGVMEAEE